MNGGDVRINLRSVDLNLLVMFDALITERHVTRAAARVAMSQPAMSNALNRLRTLFKDELLVRTPHGMEPTDRALELRESVHQILMQTERLMQSDAFFEPATSERSFTIRMSDLVGTLLLPGCMRRLADEAPKVVLDVLHMAPERSIRALSEDQLDFAVSFELAHDRSIVSEPLLPDRMVCAMRKGHPLSAGRLTLKRFLEASHLRVAMSPTDLRFVDSKLAAQGLSRNITVNVPQWLLVPEMLRETDLLGVVSERFGEKLTKHGIVCRPLPFEAPEFEWRIYSQHRYAYSKVHIWMKQVILDVAARIRQ
ncbi:LysR family transcriptional regulator [Achromobacter aloeverae]|uniref:LysR family transcriptional regulator n=1 Tax=Achromobacter aloeverae TaxID=1750518 RepID=A0A4V1MSE2_9BURK|nr:LysR family transcriptional regulator [Achromobacter aloeverae]RXN91269.1 LysR family transcriptional regulator [Achromobacter aloeverae]